MDTHATTHRHVAEQAIIDAWIAQVCYQVAQLHTHQIDKMTFFNVIMSCSRVASSAMQGVRSID